MVVSRWLCETTPEPSSPHPADDERTFSYQGGTGLNRWTLRDLDGRVLREFSATNGTNCVATADWVWRGGSLLAAEYISPIEFLK